MVRRSGSPLPWPNSRSGSLRKKSFHAEVMFGPKTVSRECRGQAFVIARKGTKRGFMEKCPVCKEEQKGKYWCKACKTVFLCPAPGCGAQIGKQGVEVCPRCGLLFKEYMESRKMYRQCPKCKKKQGLSEPQCKFCKYWFNCPTCGHKVPSTSMLTCPRCATPLR